ncbi:MAG TPA: hypothetical protein VGD37_22590 [Kofleriaceae bacterium]|jgi:hypothetical protein
MPVQKSGHWRWVSMQLLLPTAHWLVPVSVPQAQSASDLHDVEQEVAPDAFAASVPDEPPADDDGVALLSEPGGPLISEPVERLGSEPVERLGSEPVEPLGSAPGARFGSDALEVAVPCVPDDVLGSEPVAPLTDPP